MNPDEHQIGRGRLGHVEQGAAIGDGTDRDARRIGESIRVKESRIAGRSSQITTDLIGPIPAAPATAAM